MASFWDLYARVYDALPRHFKPYQRLVEDIARRFESPGGRYSILDVGCGSGNFCIRLAEDGHYVKGVDFSDGMLRRAEDKKRARKLENIEFVKADVEHGLNFPDKYFDGIISIHILYSLRNPQNALEEYYRVLKPSGQLVLCEPQRPTGMMPVLKEEWKDSGLSEAVKLARNLFLIGVFDIILDSRVRSGSYHCWNRDELMGLVCNSGFKIDSVEETYTTNVDLLILARKMIMNLSQAGMDLPV